MNNQIDGRSSNYQQLDGRAKVKGSGCLGAGMIIGILVVLFIILGIMAYTSYNSMVTKEEAVKTQWAQVENLFQRRNDLIGNIVETVKGYAGHENKTLVEVIEARAKATQVNISADNLNEKSFEQFQGAQGNLNSSLSRLLVSMEAYPNLKADAQFMNLQQQLETTENQIAVERGNFNKVAQDYNTYIRKFPKNIFAGLFGFEAKGYFKAEEGADKAPKVKF